MCYGGEILPSDEELMRLARKRAEERFGFYIHFTIYVIVNLFLVAAWWFTGDGFPWFVFVLGFWGIGLVAHGASVFMGSGMTKRITEREYQRLKQGKK
jgi:hypothetical protein